ncbi:IS66 family transposase, partial [Desulfamplus magnetovallimortis]|uniref:IS66 family transposase n=1 Tax=Desulfamplus magnetovallimortis TaxID=1246637 RepID=UPI001C96F469
MFDQSAAQILVSSKEYHELKRDVGYWKRMHEKARLREEKLKQEVKELKAKIRDLTHRLFGKKSEKETSGKNEAQSKPSKPKKPRGQQPGSKGHGRTNRPNLPEKKEERNFPEPPACSVCGEAYIPDESREAQIIEVEVKAYKRVISRQHMKKNCSCKGVPATVTAPMPPTVLPRSPYGVSIWESVLLNKYLHSQPTNRLINDYAGLGLPISPGTISGGLQSLAKLFQPVYEALYQHQVTEEDLFHNDESRWKIFEHVEGKAGNLWWLWVSRSPSVVFFEIAQSRGASVPTAHF